MVLGADSRRICTHLDDVVGPVVLFANSLVESYDFDGSGTAFYAMSRAVGSECLKTGAEDRFGSISDVRPGYQPHPLLGVERMELARKQTWGLNVGCWG